MTGASINAPSDRLFQMHGMRFHSRTSYSKATPSGSFSSNQISAASVLAKALDVLGVANLLACVDVDKDGHWSLSMSGPLGPSIRGNLLRQKFHSTLS
jgi:hypothetical protein